MNNMSLDQKFAKMMLGLRRYTPFYSAMYETIPKEETERVETAGVTVNKLYYNSKFLSGKSYKELTFIILHELMHIMLMHTLRSKGKDKRLWNVACDLYINKLLVEEFNISTKYRKPDSLEITLPHDALFDESVDTDVDTAESIYDNLIKQAEENGYNTDGVGQFSHAGSGRVWGSEKSFTVENTDQEELIDNGEDSTQQENDARRVVQEANTKFEMSSGGNEYSREGSCKLQKLVANMLKSYIDWRTTLKQYCIKLRSSDTSFSNPDKRMSYQDAIYPGNTISKDNVLKDIKICIDTSGSISEEDIGYILYHIDKITKQYKTTAEILCWDTKVVNAYNMKSVYDIMNNGLAGGGGTDVKCVFNYFDNNRKGKKPALILIFTDGWFDLNDFKKKWSKDYRNTIWVMTKHSVENFNKPFGKVAVAKYDD